MKSASLAPPPSALHLPQVAPSPLSLCAVQCMAVDGVQPRAGGVEASEHADGSTHTHPLCAANQSTLRSEAPRRRRTAQTGHLPRALALQRRRQARGTTAARSSTSQGRRGSQPLTRGSLAAAGVPGGAKQQQREMPATPTPAHRRLQRPHGSRPCDQATPSTPYPTRWKPSTANRPRPLRSGRCSRPCLCRPPHAVPARALATTSHPSTHARMHARNGALTPWCSCLHAQERQREKADRFEGFRNKQQKRAAMRELRSETWEKARAGEREGPQGEKDEEDREREELDRRGALRAEKKRARTRGGRTPCTASSAPAAVLLWRP